MIDALRSLRFSYHILMFYLNSIKRRVYHILMIYLKSIKRRLIGTQEYVLRDKTFSIYENKVDVHINVTWHLLSRVVPNIYLFDKMSVTISLSKMNERTTDYYPNTIYLFDVSMIRIKYNDRLFEYNNLTTIIKVIKLTFYLSVST